MGGRVDARFWPSSLRLFCNLQNNLLLLLNRQINPAPAFGNWCNLPQFIRRARLVLLPLRQPNPLDFLLGPLLADVGPSTSLPQSHARSVAIVHQLQHLPACRRDPHPPWTVDVALPFSPAAKTQASADVDHVAGHFIVASRATGEKPQRSDLWFG